MNPENSILARKYAIAFMEVVDGQFDDTEFTRVEELKNFLRVNKTILFFLNLSLINRKDVVAALDLLYKNFKTHEICKRLTLLLVKQRRALILPDILHHIGDVYKIRTNSVFFDVTTSQAVDKEGLRAMISFIERKTSKRVLYEHAVDKNLIAGVKLQSDTLAWEYSVKRRLEELNKVLEV